MPVVLTVEDDEQVRVLAESILKEEGYETLSANGVNEALALLRSDQKIDILFTDIQLGADFQGGLDVARKSPWSIALDGTSPTGCEHSSSNIPFI
jgi:CheY-like chemotaxis protein